MGNGNDKTVENGQSRLALLFPIGCFILGLLFVGAVYTVLFLKTTSSFVNQSFWEAIQLAHRNSPFLFVIDSLPFVLAFIGVFVGIKQKKRVSNTERMRSLLEEQNRKIKSLQFLYAVTFEKSDDCLIIASPEGDVIDISLEGARILGIDKLVDKGPKTRESLVEILKKNKINIRSIYANGEDRDRVLEELSRNRSMSNIRLRLKRLSGETFDALVSGFMGENSDGQPMIFVRILDMSNFKQAELLLRKVNEQLERKNEELVKAFSELQAMKVRFENRTRDLEKLNKQLNYANKLLSDMAITDGLTSLYNHKHFMELLGKEWERSKRNKNRFCVIMIDVDYFKVFNDKWGHQLGDQALKSLAKTIQSQTRSYDVVARYGGEEFSLLLPDTDLNTCYTVAQRIRKAVERKTLLIKSHEEKVHITVSVGVTIFMADQEDARSFEQVLQDADVALYLAKNRGRNRVEMYRRDVLSETAHVVPIPEINGEE